jgi:hypothetical protein
MQPLSGVASVRASHIVQYCGACPCSHSARGRTRTTVSDDERPRVVAHTRNGAARRARDRVQYCTLRKVVVPSVERAGAARRSQLLVGTGVLPLLALLAWSTLHYTTLLCVTLVGARTSPRCTGILRRSRCGTQPLSLWIGSMYQAMKSKFGDAPGLMTEESTPRMRESQTHASSYTARYARQADSQAGKQAGSRRLAEVQAR